MTLLALVRKDVLVESMSYIQWQIRDLLVTRLVTRENQFIN